METKLIKIDYLVTENLQVRVTLDENAIADYAEAMKDGAVFPPIVVFCDAARPYPPSDSEPRSGGYRGESAPYLADGFHRVEAARRAGHDTILAEVHEGTFDDAIAFALKANDKHGVRRTNEDKRNAMEIAWENWRMLLGDEVPKGKTNNKPSGLPSGEQLATLCCVSERTADYFIAKKLKRNLRSSPNTIPDALSVTREHLEERDPSVRALLKDGKDRFGVEIPDRLKAAFLSREPRLLVRELNRIYADLEKHRLEGDIVFAPFVGYAMTHLDNLVSTIKHGMVYCVCRMCRGRGCGSCNNLGFQTRPQYDRNPSEFKAEKQ